MVSTTSGKIVLTLTVCGALWGLLDYWGLGFHFLVGSDHWQADVSQAFNFLSAVSLLGFILTLGVLMSLVQGTRQSLMAWTMLFYCGIHWAACFYYLDRLDAHSESIVSLRTWSLSSIPGAMWCGAAIVWIRDLAVTHSNREPVLVEQLLPPVDARHPVTG